MPPPNRPYNQASRLVARTCPRMPNTACDTAYRQIGCKHAPGHSFFGPCVQVPGNFTEQYRSIDELLWAILKLTCLAFAASHSRSEAVTFWPSQIKLISDAFCGGDGNVP